MKKLAILAILIAYLSTLGDTVWAAHVFSAQEIFTRQLHLFGPQRWGLTLC